MHDTRGVETPDRAPDITFVYDAGFDVDAHGIYYPWTHEIEFELGIDVIKGLSMLDSEITSHVEWLLAHELDHAIVEYTKAFPESFYTSSESMREEYKRSQEFPYYEIPEERHALFAATLMSIQEYRQNMRDTLGYDPDPSLVASSVYGYLDLAMDIDEYPELADNIAEGILKRLYRQASLRKESLYPYKISGDETGGTIELEGSESYLDFMVSPPGNLFVFYFGSASHIGRLPAGYGEVSTLLSFIPALQELVSTYSITTLESTTWIFGEHPDLAKRLADRLDVTVIWHHGTNMFEVETFEVKPDREAEEIISEDEDEEELLFEDPTRTAITTRLVSEASVPEHPDTVILTTDSGELTEQEIYDYWMSVQDEILDEVTNRNVMLVLKVDDQLVYKRKDGAGNPLRLIQENYADVVSGRLIEIHAEFNPEDDLAYVDLDPKPEFQFEEVKRIASDLISFLEEQPEVETVQPIYSGRKGIHLHLRLLIPHQIDETRLWLKSLLEEYSHRSDVDDDRLTTSITDEPGTMRLDYTLNKERGTYRVPYSLTDMGRVTLPIEDIDNFTISEAEII